MAQCPKCGKELAENQKFCPACGTAAQASQASQPFTYQGNPSQSGANNFFADLFAMPDETAKHSQEDISVNRVAAIFAYIGLFFLIPLLACKNSPFAQFHAKQGLVLCLAGVAVSIVSIPLMLIPIAGILFGVIFGLLEMGLTALAVLGIVNVAMGKAKRLPIFGRITWFG